MDEFRSLPPLVRGKATASLNFFVDELRLFKSFVLKDKTDVVLQVQWWGESLPVFLRPKKFVMLDENGKKFNETQSTNYSAKYQLRTSLGLFENYLNTCEKLELCVLEKIDNNLIGSAFLHDLLKVFNEKHETICLSVYDYLGNVIGDVTIYISIFNHSKKDVENTFKSYNEKDMSYKQINEGALEFDSNFQFNFEPTYDKTLVFDAIPSKNKDTINKDIEALDLKSLSASVTESSPTSSYSEIYEKKFPEVQALKDSSKVLDYKTDFKNKINVNSFSSAVPVKYNIQSIKCKRKSIEPKHLKIKVLEPTFKVDIEKSKIKKLLPHPKLNSSNKALKVKDNEEEMKKFKDDNSVPEDSMTKVLNYLLGSDMNKDEEESAVAQFKTMSPSHNLVDSVSQLYLLRKKKPLSNSVLKPTPLSFDLSNPIERNYYEKFFMKFNSPKNSKTSESVAQSETKSLSNDPIEKLPQPYRDSTLNNMDEQLEIKVDDVLSSVKFEKNGCARCKYYKKLDELDTIIESLKHFEKKIIANDKDMSFKPVKIE